MRREAAQNRPESGRPNLRGEQRLTTHSGRLAVPSWTTLPYNGGIADVELSRPAGEFSCLHLHQLYFF